MKTKILKPSRKAYKVAKNLIKNEEVVAFPTETVYGLGANAFSDNAVKKIYERKGREQDNPLIVHFARKKDITKVAVVKDNIEKQLIKKCMPGPISIVLDKKPGLCQTATCGLETVACRIPSNRVARSFICSVGVPVCAPSANLSKRPSPTTAKDVFEDMNGKIALIIDGGDCNIGIESTVVRVADGKIYILRPGRYSADYFRKNFNVEVVENVKSSGVPVSPGTKYSHYCPKIEMFMVVHNTLENINNLYDLKILEGKNPVILCSQTSEKFFAHKNHVVLGKDNIEASKNLFKVLREVEKNYDLIIAEFIENGDMKEGLFNRMSKASSGNII